MYHTTYVSSDYHVVGWSEQYLIGIVSFQTPPSYEGKGSGDIEQFVGCARTAVSSLDKPTK